MRVETAGRNQWAIARSADELRKVAKRAASQRKLAVDIVRLVSPHEIAGVLYLVPDRNRRSGAPR